MHANKWTVAATIVVFIWSLICCSPGGLVAQSAENQEITRMLKEAEEAYQNGNFVLAIEKYQKLIELFNSKRELAKVKQDLLQTMGNLALTYFTIRENEKAEKQLIDLLRINPNYVLDPEIFPPRFLELFNKVQRISLGKLNVTSAPIGAEISLNGNPVGKSPQTVEKLFKGSYELKVELTGYKPVAKQIDIAPEAATVETITLEKTERGSPIVEKTSSQPLSEAKKKKRFPLLVVIIGGVAAIAVAAFLLLNKKEETPPEEQTEKDFLVQNNDKIEITPANVGVLTRKIISVPHQKIISRIRYKINIEHPAWEELMVTINKQGQVPVHPVWNRQPRSGLGTIDGETDVFKGVQTEGEWVITVENFKLNSGRLLECSLQFFYKE